MNADPLPLHDIHLPDPVSWWPPAIGWWILLGLVLCMMMAGAWWWRRSIAIRNAPATIARRELDRLRAQWTRQGDEQRLVSEISTWLRRAAMSLSSRRQAAGRTGEQWWRYLDEIAGEPVFDDADGRLLAQAPYRAGPGENESLNAEHLLELCERWLDAATRRRRQR